MSYKMATKEEVEQAGLEWKEPVKAAEVHATGPGGKIYRIPVEDAAKYEVAATPQGEHSPIMSYDDLASLVDWEGVEKAGEADEVSGHHAVMDNCGRWVWHINCMYGPTGDGIICYHYHPHGTPFWRSC